VKEEEVNPPCLKDLESIFERENTTREERKEGNPEDLLVSADPDLGPSTMCGGCAREGGPPMKLNKECIGKRETPYWAQSNRPSFLMHWY